MELRSARRAYARLAALGVSNHLSLRARRPLHPAHRLSLHRRTPPLVCADTMAAAHTRHSAPASLGDYSLLPQARLSRGLAHVSSEYAHVCGMLADRRLVVTRYVLFVASIRVSTEAVQSHAPIQQTPAHNSAAPGVSMGLAQHYHHSIGRPPTSALRLYAMRSSSSRYR